MRHPSEYFIKYLVTLDHPMADQNTWIASSLSHLGLPQLEPETSESYLSLIREEMEEGKPNPLKPDKEQKHRPSLKYLKDKKIYSLYNPDTYSKEATADILGNMQVRPMVETMLLGRVPHKEIARKVNEKFGMFLRAESVAAYEHYYWNVNLLTVDDWVRLFEGSKKAGTVESIIQGGRGVALFRLGYPVDVDAKDVLQQTLETLYFDLQDWKTQPRSIEKTKALNMIAKAVTLLDEQLSQAESAIKDSLKAFEKFRIDQLSEKPRSIKQLAPEGNYSGSGKSNKEVA